MSSNGTSLTTDTRPAPDVAARTAREHKPAPARTPAHLAVSNAVLSRAVDGDARPGVAALDAVRAAAGNAAAGALLQRDNGGGGANPPPGGGANAPGAPAGSPGPQPSPEDLRFFEAGLSTVLGALGKKAMVKGGMNFPIKERPIFKDYLKVDSLSVSGEASVELAKNGNATVVSTQQGASAAGTSTMQDTGRRKKELDSKGRVLGLEIKTVMDGLLNDSLKKLTGGTASTATEVKWVGLEALMEPGATGKAQEVSIGFEITEKMEIQLGGGFSLTPMVSASLGAFAIKMPSKEVKVGAASVNLAGELAKKETMPEIEVAGLRLPKYDKAYALKLQGSANASINKEKVLYKVLEVAGKKVAEKAGLGAVAKGLDILKGPQVKMITIGVLTVCNLIDAYIEGDRQKNLGEMAASLPYVFAGGYLSGYQKMSVDTPATKYGPVAEFQGAGKTAGEGQRTKAIAELKAKPEAKDAPANEVEEAVDKTIKEKPAGIADVAITARQQVDSYVLKKFIEGRENGATKVFDFLAGTDHKIDENSPEYKKFRDEILKAYTTKQNDPYYGDQALKNAVEAAQKAQVPPDKLNEWIANYMMKVAQGAIDQLDPDTREDELAKNGAKIDDLLSGWVTDEDIRAVQPIVLNTPKDKGRDILLQKCGSWKGTLNRRQAKLLSDLTGC